MRLFLLAGIIALILFIRPVDCLSQGSNVDSASEAASVSHAIQLYHDALAPEPDLYSGSEYVYKTYYPFVINEGDPFFQSKQFDTGMVFYNGALFQNVPLLYDLVKGELLIKHPGNIYIIRLNGDRIKWFSLLGHTFNRLVPDSISSFVIKPGFYDVLHKGNASLYNKISKIFKENSSSFDGLNKYIVERDEYFIYSGGRYFPVKNKKTVLAATGNRKKEVDQFIRKNKLNFRKDKENALMRAVAYFDSLQQTNVVNP